MATRKKAEPKEPVRIHRQSSSDGSLRDYIHMMDIKQNDPETARVCQADPDHGRLTVHASGNGLVCGRYLGIVKTEAGKASTRCCTYVEPLSR